MTQELLLIRGLPGSGKSTFAKLLLSFDGYDYQNIRWFEADMYFMEHVDISWIDEEDVAEKGKAFWVQHHGYEFVYKYDREKIGAAHVWCQKSVWEALQDKNAIVIVSNTFSTKKELQPYIEMADKLDCKLTVLTVEGNFGSVHNVPEETINKMKNRWERYDG